MERGNPVRAADEAPGSGVAGMEAMARPRMKMPGRQHKLSQQHKYCESRKRGLSPALLHSIGLQKLSHLSGTLRHEKDHLWAEMSIRHGSLVLEQV
jgi:hypothetical protein